MPPSPLSALRWRGASALRHLRSRIHAHDVVVDPVELSSTAGYRLAGKTVRPRLGGPFPGLAVSPAIHQGVAALMGTGAVVSAIELARLGYVVLVHDPAGRGDSWGEEDFGGPEHQDDLRVAVRALTRDPGCTGRVGVLSLSLGIAAATGALTRWPDLPVDWLVDWEGPCDRETVTAGGAQMLPAAGHPLDDEHYWPPREALAGIPRLTCGYVRLQAFPDHAQPDELRHARRMLVAATGAAWRQLNDHPRGQVPDRPAWLPGGPLAANGAILRKLATLRG
ncbi:MAG: hypothetical protein EXR71_14155 [Myxococcales bacterium]|nr:hypothetical protein [Myxococcales bacterium]